MESKYPLIELRDAAYSYLGEWWMTDRDHHQRLLRAVEKHDCEAGAAALKSFAAAYGVSRTLSGVSMELAFEELASLSGLGDVVSTVNLYAKKLGDETRLPISAASKLLWLRFREDVPIYDSLACRFMETWYLQRSASRWKWSPNRSDWYGQFLELWNDSYGEARATVDEACSELVTIQGLVKDKLPSSRYFDVVHEAWFKQRVFDHFIQR